MGFPSTDYNQQGQYYGTQVEGVHQSPHGVYVTPRERDWSNPAEQHEEVQFRQNQGHERLAPFYNQGDNGKEVFSTAVAQLVERADELVLDILGKGKKENKTEEGTFLSPSRVSQNGGGGSFIGRDLTIGSNNWGPTSIGGGRNGKSNALIAILGAVIAGIGAYLIGSSIKDYFTNRREIKNDERLFGVKIDNWRENTAHCETNEHFQSIKQIFNDMQALRQEKLNSAWWNLALTVGIATAGFFIAAGAIASIDAMMVGGGLALLGFGVVTLVRLGYRYKDTEESLMAKDLYRDCGALMRVEAPLRLLEDQRGFYWA